jgi:hypothetical protein
MRRDGEGSTAVAREEGQHSSTKQSKANQIVREGLGPDGTATAHDCQHGIIVGGV